VTEFAFKVETSMEGRFVGREIVDKPTCPFCGTLIERPKGMRTRMPCEMPLGRCTCGAVYACDVTGHNLGEAMVEALVFACNEDWDRAWELLPEEDYLEDQVKHYDYETHLLVHGGVYQGRRIGGTLFFIRLNREVHEASHKEDQKPVERVSPVRDRPSTGRSVKRSFSKEEVESLVSGYQLDPLMDMAGRDKRIIRDLRRLLYSADRLLRWRAAEALGKVCAVIAESDLETVSRLLQGLFTSVSDTAASSWGALDAIGEIISRRPEAFSGYLPRLYQLTRDRALLAEILRALGKIAEAKPDLLRKMTFQFIPLLQDPDPEVRGYSAILLSLLKAIEARDDLLRLEHDPSAIEIYRNGDLVRITVGELSSQSLKTL
jgi:hypothetical protein